MKDDDLYNALEPLLSLPLHKWSSIGDDCSLYGRLTLGHVRKLQIAFKKQTQEIEKMRGALRFYGWPEKYTDINGDDATIPDFYDELDFGLTARLTLGEKQ